MYNNDQTTLWLPDLQDQKSLTLCWCSFLGDSSYVVAGVFVLLGGQYIQYALKQPRLWSITWLTSPRIVDAPLTLIFRLGQGACFSCFWLPRQPIHQKGQWCTKVNILRLEVQYLNVSINRKTWKPEPEIGTDGSSQPSQNPCVDGWGSGFGLPRTSYARFWTVLELKWIIFVVRTCTTRGIPEPIAITI